MRGLELALIVVDALMLLCWLRPRFASPRLRWLPVAGVALLMAQVAVEGQRWTMYPAYLVTTFLFAVATWPRLRARQTLMALAGVVLLIGAASASSILPVFDYPRPSGPFPVGSVTRHLIDTNREEPHAPGRGQPRELMVQIWYPAAGHGPRLRYREGDNIPFFKRYITLIRTNAAGGVPVAPEPSRHPVVIYSPSWGGRRVENTVQAEELASHGYVVVGIDHPFATRSTTFPDGRTVTSTVGTWMDFSSEDAMQKTLANVELELSIRATDVRFVLDILDDLNRFDSSGLFTGRLDTTRAGVFGSSFGGAVAAEACRLDPRFQAAIDYDGCLFGSAAREGVLRPLLVMSSENPIRKPISSDASAEEKIRSRFLEEDIHSIDHTIKTFGGYLLAITGALHPNFSDGPLFRPIGRMGGGGSISQARAFEIIDDCTLSFFDEFVKKENRGFPSVSLSRYPELTLVFGRSQALSMATPAPW